MEAKVALIRLNKEVMSELYEITKQGDLEKAVADIFAKARAAQIDLWKFHFTGHEGRGLDSGAGLRLASLSGFARGRFRSARGSGGVLSRRSKRSSRR